MFIPNHISVYIWGLVWEPKNITSLMVHTVIFEGCRKITNIDQQRTWCIWEKPKQGPRNINLRKWCFFYVNQEGRMQSIRASLEGRHPNVTSVVKFLIRAKKNKLTFLSQIVFLKSYFDKFDLSLFSNINNLGC